MRYARMKWGILILLSLLCNSVFGHVYITETGRAGTGQSGQINIAQNLQNDGHFDYLSSHVRFFGDGTSRILGNSGLYVQRLVLDKTSGSYLYLMEPVGVGDSLLLKSGIMTFSGRAESSVPPVANEARKLSSGKEASSPLSASSRKQTNLSRLSQPYAEKADWVFTEEYPSKEVSSRPPSITTREGSLTLGDYATIRREEGALLATPALNGTYDLIYQNSVTTGAELVSDQDALNSIIVDIPSGTLTLDKDAWINESLIIENGSLNTGSYTLTMGEFAPVVGYPDDITGTIVGEDIRVNTSSYSNGTFYVSLNSGTSIGDFRQMLYMKPISIGTVESIERLWYLDSDIWPNGRNMVLGWRRNEDNGIDLSHVQVWRSDDLDRFYAWGDPIDMSGTGNLRAIDVNNIDRFGWWTIGHPIFGVSSTTIDLGDVEIGQAVSNPLTVTNYLPSSVYGYIVTPDWITPIETTRNRSTARKDLAREEENSVRNRESQYFNMYANGDVDFNLICSPNTPGEFSETVQVIVYNELYPTRLIEVRGVAVMPDIEVTPDQITHTLAQDESASRQVTIQNAGDVQLDYSVYFGENLLGTSFEGDFPPSGWTMEIVSGEYPWSQADDISHAGTSSGYGRLAFPG